MRVVEQNVKNEAKSEAADPFYRDHDVKKEGSTDEGVHWATDFSLPPAVERFFADSVARDDRNRIRVTRGCRQKYEFRRRNDHEKS